MSITFEDLFGATGDLAEYLRTRAPLTRGSRPEEVWVCINSHVAGIADVLIDHVAESKGEPRLEVSFSERHLDEITLACSEIIVQAALLASTVGAKAKDLAEVLREVFNNEANRVKSGARI